MRLSPGARLGPYEVTSAIGAGGMGEVYKARDTRLDRTVAIKILPAEIGADPERRARFSREAKIIAGLSHPHICTLHDVGEHEGTTFLVMEHLTGETLADRLQKGPLPLDQALGVATEVADALAAAHRQGVIHRDLKPGNVMLTKAGAKLLDFGLAKLAGHGEQPAAASLASAPTRTAPLTSEGSIVGTLQYMAPEQVEGKPADARTDLWALGAILYEMLTGQRAFEGGSAASLIANIMSAQPPTLVTLQPVTPPALDRLVRQCLAKSPEDRPDTAHDVANDLRWLREGSGVGATTSRVQPQRLRGVRTALAIAAGLCLLMAGAGLTWLLRPAPSQGPVARLTMDVRPAEEVHGGEVTWNAGGALTALTWTPDGQALVFVGRRDGVQQLYVRRLDGTEAHPLTGTEAAEAPAVSPDGQWVAFWAAGALKKVRLTGGPAVQLAPGIKGAPPGLAWDSSGALYFGNQADGAIWKVQPGGSLVRVTTRGATELRQSLPSVLPGGQVLLYTVARHEAIPGDEEIVGQTLGTGQRTVVLRDATDARYVPTGHLVFMREGVLLAVAFNPRTLQVQGDVVPLLDGVAHAVSGLGGSGDRSLAGQFAVASTGSLAWLAGSVAPPEARALVAVDRQGVTPLNAPVKPYGRNVRLAPDGRKLLLNIFDGHDAALWTYDLVSGTLAQVFKDGEATHPVWTPDGQHLVFWWNKEGRRSLAWRRADGTGPPESLAGDLIPSSWTPDGRRLAAVDAEHSTIVVLAVENGRATATPWPDAPNNAEYPEFSPDGRWLAYASWDSGSMQNYVQPYPGPGPRVQLPPPGGMSPAWRRDGRALFYLSRSNVPGRGRLMEVEFQPGTPPRIGTPRQIGEGNVDDLLFTGSETRAYDVSLDGQRFYVLQSRSKPPIPHVTQINIVLNWFEELKAKVPGK